MGFLKNFRRGFATNSSSSHSFVYMKKPNHEVGFVPAGMEFGWGDFRLSTLKEKLFYVLVDRIGGGGWESSVSDAEEAMEVHGHDFPEFEKADFESAMASYVDHQSSGEITIDQARDPFITIFGGNDNSDGSVERMNAFSEIDWSRTDPNWYEEEKLEGKPSEEFISGVEKYVQSPF